VIKLGVRIEQWRIAEHWLSRPALAIPTRLSSLKLKEDEAGNDPKRLVFIVKIAKEGVAAEVFSVIRVDD
jgi:hypothetical protein